MQIANITLIHVWSPMNTPAVVKCDTVSFDYTDDMEMARFIQAYRAAKNSQETTHSTKILINGFNADECEWSVNSRIVAEINELIQTLDSV